MNRIYRIVWSHTIGAWVVANERARARGKRSTTRHGLAAAVLAVAGLGIAGPGGMPQALADPCVANADLVQAEGDACTAMVVDGAVDLIDNSGEISGDGVPAIHVNGGSLGLLINRESGEILNVQNHDAVLINNGATVGDIENSGDIITPDRDGININGAGTTITGEVRNSGTISGRNYGISVRTGSAVDGGIHNEAGGMIHGSDHTNANSAGLIVTSSTVNPTTVAGGITNAGTIEGRHGINVTSSSAIGTVGGIHNLDGGLITGHIDDAIRINNSIVDGDITNSGVLSGNTHGVRVVNGSSVTGAVLNSGTIEGNSNHGLTIDNASIGGDIDNQAGGEILGAQSGIRVSGGSTVDGAIVNSGLLSGGALHGLHVDDVVIAGDIRNTADGEIQGNSDAIHLSGGSTVGGSIINDGAIQATDSAIFATNTTVDGDIRNDAGGQISGGRIGFSLDPGLTVGGSVINSGAMTGLAEEGIRVSDTLIDGAIINRSGASITAGDGIVLLNASTVGGGIHNEAGGEIIVTDNGIRITDNATVGMDDQGVSIHNAGVVQSGMTAIHVEDTQISGDVVNASSGDIRSGARGIDLAVTSLGHLINDGTIEADEDGIRVSAGSIVDGDVVNSGALQSGLTGIHVENTQISGDVVNASSGEIRSGTHGIDLSVTSLGHLINDGSIEAVSDGIRVSDATVDGDIVNRGAILGEANGLVIDTTTVSGGIVMDSGASIEGTGHGIRISNSGIGGALVNQGTITGGDVGIEILAGASAPSLLNHGTIEGSEHALLVSQDSGLDTLRIAGDSARFIGDVIARNTAVTLDTDAAFTNDNAFEVLSFHVSEGAVLRLGPGVTSSTDLDDGIATTDGFINDGTIEIAAGDQPVIHGDYSQGSHARLNVTMIDADNHSRLIVSDNAQLDGMVFVDASAATTLGVGQVLEDVISAGSIDGNFSAIEDSSLLFDFVSIASANSVDFEIVRGLSVGEVVGEADNPAAGGVADAIDDIIDSGPQSGDMQAIINALGAMSSGEEISDAMSQLLPLMTASQSRAILSSLRGAHRAVQTQQAADREQATQWQVWARPFGAWSDQDNRKGVAGHDADTVGVVIGGDTAIGGHSRIGLGLSIARSDVDSKSTVAVHSADINSYSFMLHGRHALGERTSLDVLLDYGWHSTDGQRRIAFGDIDRVVRADYSSNSLHLGAGASQVIPLGHQTRFVPSLRMAYTSLSDDAYEEQGGDALGLQVDSHSLDEWILSIDGHVAHDLNRRTTVSAGLGLGYDLADDQGTVTARLAGAPDTAFVTRGLDTDPLLLRAGLGFDSRLTDQLLLQARYDIESRSDYLRQGLSLQFTMAF